MVASGCTHRSLCFFCLLSSRVSKFNSESNRIAKTNPLRTKPFALIHPVPRQSAPPCVARASLITWQPICWSKIRTIPYTGCGVFALGKLSLLSHTHTHAHTGTLSLSLLRPLGHDRTHTIIRGQKGALHIPLTSENTGVFRFDFPAAPSLWEWKSWVLLRAKRSSCPSPRATQRASTVRPDTQEPLHLWFRLARKQRLASVEKKGEENRKRLGMLVSILPFFFILCDPLVYPNRKLRLGGQLTRLKIFIPSGDSELTVTTCQPTTTDWKGVGGYRAARAHQAGRCTNFLLRFICFHTLPVRFSCVCVLSFISLLSTWWKVFFGQYPLSDSEIYFAVRQGSKEGGGGVYSMGASGFRDRKCRNIGSELLKQWFRY